MRSSFIFNFIRRSKNEYEKERKKEKRIIKKTKISKKNNILIIRQTQSLDVTRKSQKLHQLYIVIDFKKLTTKLFSSVITESD